MVYLLLVHLFPFFARVNFCSFTLLFGVRGWLRLVSVALPGMFYEPTHEIMALIALRKLNFQTRMRSNPLRLHV